MKVLMTTDAAGGVLTYALDLARGLVRAGTEVVLATMGPRRAPLPAEALAIEGLTVRESEHRLEWMEDPWEDVARAGEWLLSLEREHRPDVVHLNAYSHGALPFRAPVVVVAHACMRSWFEAVKGHPAPESWDTYTRNVRAGLRGANHVVALTRARLAALVEHYGWLPATSVIANGRDETGFMPAKKEDFVFATGHAWDEANNVGCLERLDVPWPIYLAGDAERPSPRRLGALSPRAIAAWMSRAAIYAFPALYEPLGLSVLEAALSGCALVLGDVPSLRESWGSCALFVNPRDERALADAITTLVRDRGKRHGLARRARLRASHYDLATAVASYRALYTDLCDQLPGTRRAS